MPIMPDAAKTSSVPTPTGTSQEFPPALLFARAAGAASVFVPEPVGVDPGGVVPGVDDGGTILVAVAVAA